MKIILFIDDDPYWSQMYREQLQKLYEITYKSSADGGLAVLHDSTVKIEMLILDVMMDTPDSVDITETEGGLMTGVWVLKNMKDTLIKSQLPIVVLTNRAKKVVIDAINELGYPASQVEVYSKAEMSAKHLPSLVQAKIEKK